MFMHNPGPLAPWPDLAGPHTVRGGGGGPPPGGAFWVGAFWVGAFWVGLGVGVLELVSDAPRMTPTAISAAPTEAQPIQAIWVVIHRHERRAGHRRGGGGRRRAGGLYEAGSSV
jgi:hypothetical protein